MDSILRILGNTPVWVFALFAYLAWQGVQSLRPRVLPVWRVLMAPMVFILMGVSRIVLGRADGQWPIIAWAVAAVALAAAALVAGRASAVVDRGGGRVLRPGSPMPLIRNVIVFGLQYAIAVMAARHLDDRFHIAIIGNAVSGGIAGYFFGWAAAFLLRRHVGGQHHQPSDGQGRMDAQRQG